MGDNCIKRIIRSIPTLFKEQREKNNMENESKMHIEQAKGSGKCFISLNHCQRTTIFVLMRMHFLLPFFVDVAWFSKQYNYIT